MTISILSSKPSVNSWNHPHREPAATASKLENRKDEQMLGPISRRVAGIWFSWFIWFVWFLWFVWFREQNKRDKPDRPNKRARLPLNLPHLAQRSLPFQSDGYATDFSVD